MNRSILVWFCICTVGFHTALGVNPDSTKSRSAGIIARDNLRTDSLHKEVVGWHKPVVSTAQCLFGTLKLAGNGLYSRSPDDKGLPAGSNLLDGRSGSCFS